MHTINFTHTSPKDPSLDRMLNTDKKNKKFNSCRKIESQNDTETTPDVTASTLHDLYRLQNRSTEGKKEDLISSRTSLLYKAVSRKACELQMLFSECTWRSAETPCFKHVRETEWRGSLQERKSQDPSYQWPNKQGDESRGRKRIWQGGGEKKKKKRKMTLHIQHIQLDYRNIYIIFIIAFVNMMFTFIHNTWHFYPNWNQQKFDSNPAPRLKPSSDWTGFTRRHEASI